MILHIAANNWGSTDVNGFAWQTFNFFDSIVRWGVPVFVMISGSIFLSREMPIKKIYSKYILRMAISFVAWSVIYSIFSEGNLREKMAEIIYGHYHMWFILMIIGLYMCIPAIKPIIANDTRIKYYLCVAFLFAFAIPEIITLANDFGNKLIVNGAAALQNNADDMNMKIVLGFASYFILGYYFNKTTLSKKQRMIIYALGFLGFAFTIGMDLIVALKTQKACKNYYGNFTVNVLFEALAVFTWFKYHFHNERTNDFIRKLSKYSFGAYLVHALVIEQLDKLVGLNTLSFNPILSVICIGAIVFAVSFGISAVLNHIPIIKKYIV